MEALLLSYPYSHGIIAAALGSAAYVATGAPAAALVGSGFYAIRELWQHFRQGRAWDMPGFIWGVGPGIALMGIFHVL